MADATSGSNKGPVLGFGEALALSPEDLHSALQANGGRLTRAKEGAEEAAVAAALLERRNILAAYAADPLAELAAYSRSSVAAVDATLLAVSIMGKADSEFRAALRQVHRSSFASREAYAGELARIHSDCYRLVGLARTALRPLFDAHIRDLRNLKGLDGLGETEIEAQIAQITVFVHTLDHVEDGCLDALIATWRPQ